jgi:hypothetical protein
LLPIVPFLLGAVTAIDYLENVATPTVDDFLTLGSYFLAVVLVALIVQIFLLVLCLRPSKSKEDGNRYAE